MKSFQELAEDFVREHGTANQRERLKAGVDLPEQELHDTVQKTLFKAVSDLPKWRHINLGRIRELAVKRGLLKEGAYGRVEFEVVAINELSGSAWERLKVLRELLPAAQTKIFLVIATCNDEIVRKYQKVRLILTFHGRDFVTEINLSNGVPWPSPIKDSAEP